MTEHDEKRRHVSSTKHAAELAVAGLALIVVAIMCFSTITGSRMAERYAPLVDASLEIKLEATMAHLWLEEAIADEKHEGIEVVWHHLDQSAWFAHAMLEGGENAEVKLAPMQDKEIRQEIVDAVESISAFRAIAEERWNAATQSGIGSDIDQRYDAVFERFINEADEVEASLRILLAKDLRSFKMMQLLLIAVCVILAVAIAVVLRRFEKKRENDMQALQTSEANLSVTLDSIGDAVITTDTQGKVTRMNPVAEALTGWNNKESQGRPLDEVFHIINTETRAEAENPVQRVLREGNVVGLANHTALLSREGKERQIADSAAPIRTTAGTVTGVVLVFRDVTDEYSKDQQLRESQQYLKSIMENEPECVKLVRSSGELLDMNPAGLRMILAESKDQVIGKSVYSLIAEEDRERYKQFNERVCGGQTDSLQFVMLDFDGQRHHMESTSAPLPYGSENEIVQLGITRDITSKKRAEEERKHAESLEKHSRQKHALHIKRTPLGVIEWNTDFEVVEWNPAASRIFGYTRDEAIGRHAVGLLVSESVKDHVNRIWSDLLTTKGGLRSNNMNLTKSGATIDCEWYNTPLVNDRGDVLGVTSLVQDVTERKKSDAERERLMLAIEQANEIIVITDADGTIQYTNPAFERVTEYSAAEAIGQKPSILRSGEHDEAFFDSLWDAVTRGETWSGQLISKKKDGTVFNETTTISPVRDSSGAIVNFVAVSRDITEEIKLTSQLRQAQKMEAIGNLAGGMAHDFNNLLQVISGFTELALEEVGDQEVPRSALQQVSEAADSAAELTRQLLAFSRRQVLQPVDLDLNELVANLMKMLRRLIGEHITLKIISGQHLGHTRADRGQIEQVLVNLCVNARDAMPSGGTICIETENVVVNSDYCQDHPWAKEGKYVLLSVNDTGHGMDEQTKEQIFEPFFTTKGVGEGTGLGLATVYGIVKQHDGMLQVYSEVDQGSTFKIYLPVVERPAGAVGDKIKRASPTGTETILVAEDEATVLQLARQILERAGYTVLTAQDGEEALEIFEKSEHDIALTILDVVMPKLGGHIVRKRILEKSPDARILFTSGYSENGVHTNFVLEDGLQLIQKPYDRDQLLREIRKAIDK